MSKDKDQAATLRLRGADGLELTGTAFGPSDGAPVVLMHGGGQSRTAWLGTARLLGGAGYRAISLDLRGHGQSDWSPEAGYAFEDYARDLASVLAQFGRPATLVGASLGGRVALIAAADRPERVSALVICDTAHIINEGARVDMRSFFGRSRAGFATLDEAAAVLAAISPDRPRGTSLGLRPPPRAARRPLSLALGSALRRGPLHRPARRGTDVGRTCRAGDCPGPPHPCGV